MEADIKLCMGSDCSIALLNAIGGIYEAVTRQTVDGGNPTGRIPKQKTSVVDAIKGYMISSAYATFEEKDIVSIEPNKLADMVILSEDILTIKPKKIQELKVLMTIFDGKIIYEKK